MGVGFEPTVSRSPLRFSRPVQGPQNKANADSAQQPAQQPDSNADPLAADLADALSALPEADRLAVVAHVRALAKLSPAKRLALLTLTRE